MAADCVATVSVYSGRPDPEWPLSVRQVEGLRRAWSQLKAERSRGTPPPALGYRGTAMGCAAGDQWRAYRGIVTHTAGGKVESRKDEGRRFEKALLATAPKGAIPSGIAEIDELLNR